jgi:hypothetical protein
MRQHPSEPPAERLLSFVKSAEELDRRDLRTQDRSSGADFQVNETSPPKACA